MPNDECRARVLAAAPQRVGIPYRIDPPPDGVTTLDCSLYVLLTYADAGAPFPPGARTAEQLRQACASVAWDDVQPGDLLFFEQTYDAPGPAGPDGRIASHVGISLGAGTRRMWDCHASSSPDRPDGAGQTDISTVYWQEHLFAAGCPRGLAPGAPGTRYRVTDDGVRLRAEPGTTQPILIPGLGAGMLVTLERDEVRAADGYLWWPVRTADGVAGWVAATFLAPADGGADLPDDPDHVFAFAALWPHIQAAAARAGADAQVLAAIVAQESSFTNWRVHRDGTGHGLIGLDDNGLLPDFERWAGRSFGRGPDATSIPPGLQLTYLAETIAAHTARLGSALAAARVWHRGPGLWQDARGEFYAARIQEHIRTLFG